MTHRKPERLALLDGLRGLAAIAVMLYHVDVASGALAPFRRSYLFVDFFFLLSGFVLALAYEPKLRDGLSSLAFIRARIRRLWPLVAVGVALGATCHLLLGEARGLATLVILGLLMLPHLGGGQIFPLNGPQWSILFELIANLAHVVILQRLGNRGLLKVLLVTAVLLGLTIHYYGSNTLGPFSLNWWYALPRVAFSYTAGIWLARHWSVLRRPIVGWQTAFALPLLLVMLLTVLPIDIALTDFLAVALAMPVLLWLAATADLPSAVGVWLQRLGALSFPLYAVHLPIVELVFHLGKSGSVVSLAIAAALVAALALTWATPLSRLRRFAAAAPAPRLT
jgi:peptidoglycan/LPS O-acetylase OafA/YrhL